MFLLQIQTRGFVNPDLNLDRHNNVVFPDQIRIQSDLTLSAGSGSGFGKIHVGYGSALLWIRNEFEEEKKLLCKADQIHNFSTKCKVEQNLHIFF
jgi:hypothetical protein